MKQHAQENAPASVQHFYPPLLPSVTLSSSIFRSIFVFASSFCPLIDASPFVYKRGQNRWFYIISLPTLIFFYRYCYSFSIYRIRYMYDVILKTSIHVPGSFRSFRRETSTIQRSISTIFTTYKSPQNLSKQSCQSKGTFQPGRPIIRLTI